MRQLDGLRALAVCSIAWHHWASPKYHLGLPWHAGVPLFFVLSGFLITGILLDARLRYEAAGTDSRFRLWRNFYIRRMLRLFPLYYCVLAWAIIVKEANLNDSFWWHAFYVSNYYIISQGTWIGATTHFWSLAVEEQFYLLWPFVLLFVPHRWMFRCFVVITLMGPLFRLGGWEPFGIATPAQFDALGLGALIAWLYRNPTTWWNWITTRREWAALGLLAAYSIVFLYDASSPFHFALLLIFALIIDAAAKGVTGHVGTFLENPIVRYIGRISYGLYLLHNFANIPAAFVLRICPPLGTIPGSVYAIKCLCTLTLAMLSWHLLEKPINGLKRHFPYSV